MREGSGVPVQNSQAPKTTPNAVVATPSANQRNRRASSEGLQRAAASLADTTGWSRASGAGDQAGAPANPTPARFTHNSPLEVAWTLIPVLILVFIGSFSLPELFKQQDFKQVEADITIKATGNQWFWSYEYPEEGIAFDSFMLAREDLAANGYDDSLYLLATDTAVVLPVGKTIVVQVTASDVIHAWKVPAFGVMQDAVPGRLAQLWFKAEKEGIYFGQCSEICGKDHAYMPITVKVVSEEAYAKWVEGAKAGNLQLASN